MVTSETGGAAQKPGGTADLQALCFLGNQTLAFPSVTRISGNQGKGILTFFFFLSNPNSRAMNMACGSYSVSAGGL